MQCRYVLCNSCKSPDTLLDRDSATRIMFLRCQQVILPPSIRSSLISDMLTSAEQKPAAWDL